MLGKPTISDVENAFQPAKEVTDAERFAGRKQAVSDSFYGLVAAGANIAIVGNRGIGKTSLARQVLSMGTGDNTLLRKLNIAHKHTFDFFPIYLACGKSVQNTDALLERLLTSRDCLGDWLYDVPKARKILTSFSPKLGAKVFGLSAELGAQKAEEVLAEPAIASRSLDSVFTNVVNAIAEEGLAEDGILIVVDEFDQIPDISGFSPFLKALATNAPKVKFCIVGVAKDIQELMKEHPSADRLFAGSIIILPSMTSNESSEIVEIAENQVGKQITFSDEAKERLVALAQGHPYMVHLAGKYALRNAFASESKLITREHINETLRSIADRQVDPILEGRYRRAVASSPQRETVLRALADTQDQQGEVWTTNAYKLALDRGVDNASQYVGQLVTEQYGSEIENLRDRYYRFKDSLFCAYVKARPRMFDTA